VIASSIRAPWAKHIDGAPANSGEALATGYSCRSQVKRMSASPLRHPLQALLEPVRRAQ